MCVAVHYYYDYYYYYCYWNENCNNWDCFAGVSVLVNTNDVYLLLIVDAHDKAFLVVADDVVVADSVAVVLVHLPNSNHVLNYQIPIVLCPTVCFVMECAMFLLFFVLYN